MGRIGLATRLTHYRLALMVGMDRRNQSGLCRVIAQECPWTAAGHGQVSLTACDADIHHIRRRR